MAALFATNIRLSSTSTILDGSKFHSICSRNLQTVSRNKRLKRVGQPNNVPRKRQSSSGKLTSPEVTQIAKKIANQQESQQWPNLRDTVSGLRATVSNISIPWWSENVVDKSTDVISESKQSVNIVNIKGLDCKNLPEPYVSSRVTQVHQDTHASFNAQSSVGDCIKDKASKLDSEKSSNEEWVTQILDITDEEGNVQDTVEVKVHLDKTKFSALTDGNYRQVSIERLGDPLAQVDAKVIPTKPATKSASKFTSRINFSYFTKSKPKSLKDSLEEQKAKRQSANGTPADQGPSTMDRIRGAVSFSSAKKNVSNSASDSSNINNTDTGSSKPEPLQIKDVKTIEAPVIPEKTPTQSDWSYWSMLSNIQQSIYLNLPLSSGSKIPVENQAPAAQMAQNIVRSELDSESALITRTINLAENLIRAESSMSKLKRLDELCTHLTKHPQFRHIALKHKVLPRLLQMQSSGSPKIHARANEALSLVGYITPPKGRGIRMLSIDGGGTRGLISIEMMKRLEQLCNRPISEMFDFVTGSSTGALMAALVFIFKIPLDECREMYLDRSARMFVKESLLKKTKNMALHDVKIFEDILQAEMGTDSLISTSRDPTIPRFAITSTLANVPKWKTFMFRNYNHPPGAVSDYEGTCNLKVWEAVRASGSAPVYFSPFQIGEYVFRDGGCIANNPTAVGIHECKLLWPHESFQCVLSLGNGRYDPDLAKEVKATGGYSVIPKAMKDLADGFIDSATDTEGVHLILKNTLPPSSYFRLSPYLRENYELSEVKPDKIHQMTGEAKSYIERNHSMLETVANKLKQERLPNQRLMDFTSQRKQTHDYFLF